MKSKKTHNEWETLVADFKKSGLSMASFCDNKGINPSTFIYWVKKFTSKVSMPKLVKIETNSVVSIPEHIQIIIGDIKLEFPSHISTEKISRFISAVREVC